MQKTFTAVFTATKLWLRGLYDWTLYWADKPSALTCLFLIAAAESSIFPIPPDVLLVAIIGANPQKWFRAAAICSFGSLVGAAVGYVIGHSFMTLAGQPIIDFYNFQPYWNRVVDLYTGVWGVWFLLVAALTPIPFKVATIAAGATGMSFVPFLVVSLLGRSLRFFLVSAILRIFGMSVRQVLERHFNLAMFLFLLLLVGGFVVLGIL